MATEKQIRGTFKINHDELSEQYYSGKSGMSKSTFDTLHGQIWLDMDAVLIAEGFMSPEIPARDFGAELDEVKARVRDLELTK